MLHAVRKVVQLLVQNSQGRLHRVESRMLSSLAVQIALNHAVQKNRFKLYHFLKAPRSWGFCLPTSLQKSGDGVNWGEFCFWDDG